MIDAAVENIIAPNTTHLIKLNETGINVTRNERIQRGKFPLEFHRATRDPYEKSHSTMKLDVFSVAIMQPYQNN